MAKLNNLFLEYHIHDIFPFMCAHFTLKAKATEIGNKFGIKISEELSFDFLVRGYLKTESAPIIIFENGKLVLKNALFSLVPSWSAEFPCKFTTYNARLERLNPKSGKTEYIYQVPTWKESFNNAQTCLIPMSGAIESSYFGTEAGHMVKFFNKEESVFYCLGLYNNWTNKTTGEVKETFTLLTDDPYKFFYDSGHDRSVLVIDDSSHEQWLGDNKMSPEQRLQFIRKKRITLDWNVTKERPLKDGWQKKAPRVEEIKSISIWKG